jgi:hypothetical protein
MGLAFPCIPHGLDSNKQYLDASFTKASLFFPALAISDDLYCGAAYNLTERRLRQVPACRPRMRRTPRRFRQSPLLTPPPPVISAHAQACSQTP